MFSFISNLCADTWDFFVAYHHWWTSLISTTWMLVAIGVVFTIVAFVISHLKIDKEDEDSESSVLPTDGWCLLGCSLMFIFMYFIGFETWDKVDGFAGFWAWVGVLSFLLYMIVFVILIVMNLVLSFISLFYYLIHDFYSGFLRTIRFQLLTILQILVAVPLLLTGLLLMSSFTGPLCAGLFLVAAFLWPTSNKIGTFQDRDGNQWEVWRH